MHEDEMLDERRESRARQGWALGLLRREMQ